MLFTLCIVYILWVYVETFSHAAGTHHFMFIYLCLNTLSQTTIFWSATLYQETCSQAVVAYTCVAVRRSLLLRTKRYSYARSIIICLHKMVILKENVRVCISSTSIRYDSVRPAHCYARSCAYEILIAICNFLKENYLKIHSFCIN